MVQTEKSLDDITGQMIAVAVGLGQGLLRVANNLPVSASLHFCVNDMPGAL